MLLPYFPECKVTLTGSSINGFGLKGCDIDMTFEHTKQVNMEIKDIPPVQRFDSGNVSQSVLLASPVKHKLRFLRWVIKESNFFEEPINVISSAHCPILSFCYKNLNCDLAYDSRGALHGTNLMGEIEKFDSRIAKLFRIITYWAKSRKLLGGPIKFKSYGLFLVLVYYLQTRNPPILPPVQEIFTKSGFSGNLNDCPNINFKSFSFEESQNKQSIEELLREFFFFYMNFDFSWTICPLSGMLADKSSLSKNEEFKVSTICVQDPFDANWNATFAASWKTCKQFLKDILRVCEIYQQQHSWLPQSEPWGLVPLISHNPLCDIVLNKDNPPTSEIHIGKMSTERAIGYVHDVLNKALLFQCEKLTTNHVLRLSSGSSDTVSQSVTECLGAADCQIMCHVKNTWAGRSNWCKQYGYDVGATNILELERDISNRILKEYQVKERTDETISFICEFCSDNEHGSLEQIVKLRPVRSTLPPKLVIFLTEYITRMVKILFNNDYKCKKPHCDLS